ncbi:MAG: hypothetical protein WCK35_17575 [Chloroflexota bacterium]
MPTGKERKSTIGFTRLVLECYYTAALFFQKKFSSLVEIKQAIPDLFSDELGLGQCPDLDVCLETLAARHQILSQSSVNWLGTYYPPASKITLVGGCALSLLGSSGPTIEIDFIGASRTQLTGGMKLFHSSRHLEEKLALAKAQGAQRSSFLRDNARRISLPMIILD